jgi:erythromycin esterase
VKRRILATAARSAVLLLAYSATAFCEEEGFAKWAATRAVPLTTVEPADNHSDLLPLVSAIGTAHIVALGEPMHGAHEPLEFRNRLFRFLVERMGFTAIGLESGFTESIGARPLIESGQGDVDSALRTGVLSWASEYPENRELIQWMRDYNAAAASTGQHRIRLYGIDMTTGGRKNGAGLTIDSALSYLSRGDPATAQTIRHSLGDSLSGIDASAFGSLPESAQAQFVASIDAIAKATQKSRQRLIAHSSVDDYHWALHNLDAARQLAECLPITPSPKDGMDLWARALTCRDSKMAKNVQWAVENEGKNGHLFVFAHDGHVMGAKEDGRRWADVREKAPMMGFHLREAYGKDIYIIASVCATTAGGLLTAQPLEDGSIERTLAGVGMPLMFLDVRAARAQKDALPWLSSRRSIDANVSAQILIGLETAVDAFVFIDTLTPSQVSAPRTP